MPTTAPPPNHHANHPAFTGLRGYLGGLTMITGRDSTAEIALALADVQPDERVVDIGCGPGAAVRLAARRGAHVIGVDPSRPMLRLARLFSRRGDIRWLEGTAEALPVSDASADVVWSIATIHHWHDLERGLAEVRRVLVPGGRFIGIEGKTASGARGHASHGWTDAQAEAFADLCGSLGLIDARVEPVTAGRHELLAVVAQAVAVDGVVAVDGPGPL
jgi:ubiquinone/menaquinone biosynthesis C-methylase UbiE